MNVQTSIVSKINNNLFKILFSKIIIEINKYYDNLITSEEIKHSLIKLNLNELVPFFTPELLIYIKDYEIAYVEAILILYVENKKPKFISCINKGTFNLVVKVEISTTNLNKEQYALRISSNMTSKINLTPNLDYYDNILYYTNTQTKKYLIKYPNILDSSYYTHQIENNNVDTISTKNENKIKNKDKNDDKNESKNIYFTHWSLSKIYTCFESKAKLLDNYKLKYIYKVQELLKYFDKNEIYYYDWKLYNFGIDNFSETSGNENLVLLDIDFESPFTIMNICSTHRLTPDPSTEIKQLNLSNNIISCDKILIAKILMYISAYLSMIAFYSAKTLLDYNKTFKRISSKYKFINDNHTVECVIKHLTNNLYSKIPNTIVELRHLYSLIKREVLNVKPSINLLNKL